VLFDPRVGYAAIVPVLALAGGLVGCGEEPLAPEPTPLVGAWELTPATGPAWRLWLLDGGHFVRQWLSREEGAVEGGTALVASPAVALVGYVSATAKVSITILTLHPEAGRAEDAQFFWRGIGRGAGLGGEWRVHLEGDDPEATDPLRRRLLYGQTLRFGDGDRSERRRWLLLPDLAVRPSVDVTSSGHYGTRGDTLVFSGFPRELDNFAGRFTISGERLIIEKFGGGYALKPIALLAPE
jgi:hypothetical protein